MIKSIRKPQTKHTWKITERSIAGGHVLYFHACISCSTPHLKAYDMTGGYNEPKRET
jgi:hypothetical protein